jgi:SET domain-containing protein
VFVKALQDIQPGEELNYDYGLILEGRHTAKVKKMFECRCGSPQCRGTMLAAKRR